VGVTVLFVTHDQIEGLSLSDRIGIMNRGKLEQVGSPEEVYYRPSTPFARDFLGKTFALSGKVVEIRLGQAEVELQGIGETPLRIGVASVSSSSGEVINPGDEVMVAIRPEQIAIWNSRPDGRMNVVPAKLESVNFLGDRYEYTVSVGAESRVLIAPASQMFRPGEKLYLELRPEGITLWPKS